MDLSAEHQEISSQDNVVNSIDKALLNQQQFKDINYNDDYNKKEYKNHENEQNYYEEQNENLKNFIKACEQNELDQVKLLVKKGIDVNKRLYDYDLDGLGYAISKGNIEIVKYLVENGANIEMKGSCSALFTAANFDKREIAEYLVEKGANLDFSIFHNGRFFSIWTVCKENSVGSYLNCHLIKSFYNVLQSFQIDDSNLNQTINLLNENQSETITSQTKFALYKNIFNNEPNKDFEKLREQRVLQYFTTREFKLKFNQLYIEYSIKQKEIFNYELNRFIRYFKEKCINSILNFPTFSNKIKFDHFDIKKITIEHKLIELVESEKTEKEKNDLIEYIIPKINEIIFKLNRTIDEWKDFFYFINQAKIQEFLKKQSICQVMTKEFPSEKENKEKEERDEEGQTKLIRACQENNFNLVKVLVEKGADLNAQDKYGKTALFYSIYQNKELVEYLIENGANIHLLDNKNQSAFLSACKHGSLDIINLLLEKGADIYKENNKCEGLIDILCYRKKNDEKEIVELLINKGLDIYQKNNFGKSILFIAILNDVSLDFIKYLLAKGININELNQDGETPLFVAVRNKSIDLVKCLIEHGADISIQNKEGKSVLMILTEISPFMFEWNKQDEIKSKIIIIDYLLEKGASLNSRDNLGRNFFFLIPSPYIRMKESSIIRREFIQNLYDSFQYTDIDYFRQTVIDSIDNENLFLITFNHIETFSYLFLNWHEENYIDEFGEKGVWKYFGNFRFKEKLVEDVINCLKNQLELLQIAKTKINLRFPSLEKEKFERKSFDNSNNLKYFQLRQIISNNFMDYLNLIQKEQNNNEKVLQLIQNIDFLIVTIKIHLSLANKLYEVIQVDYFEKFQFL